MEVSSHRHGRTHKQTHAHKSNKHRPSFPAYSYPPNRRHTTLAYASSPSSPTNQRLPIVQRTFLLFTRSLTHPLTFLHSIKLNKYINLLNGSSSTSYIFFLILIASIPLFFHFHFVLTLFIDYSPSTLAPFCILFYTLQTTSASTLRPPPTATPNTFTFLSTTLTFKTLLNFKYYQHACYPRSRP